MNFYNIKKGFISPDGTVFNTDGLHDQLACEICEKKGWDWKDNSISAEEFLQEWKGYLKVANYLFDGWEMKYVSYSKRFSQNKKVVENANLIAEKLHLRVEMF